MTAQYDIIPKITTYVGNRNKSKSVKKETFSKTPLIISTSRQTDGHRTTDRWMDGGPLAFCLFE